MSKTVVHNNNNIFDDNDVMKRMNKNYTLLWLSLKINKEKYTTTQNMLAMENNIISKQER